DLALIPALFRGNWDDIMSVVDLPPNTTVRLCKDPGWQQPASKPLPLTNDSGSDELIDLSHLVGHWNETVSSIGMTSSALYRLYNGIPRPQWSGAAPCDPLN